MKTPISINDRGDVSIFTSVEEAEAYMEPIDVEHREYIVTDADGRRLAVEVVLREASLFWGLWKARVKKVRIADPVSGNRS